MIDLVDCGLVSMQMIIDGVREASFTPENERIYAVSRESRSKCPGFRKYVSLLQQGAVRLKARWYRNAICFFFCCDDMALSGAIAGLM